MAFEKLESIKASLSLGYDPEEAIELLEFIKGKACTITIFEQDDIEFQIEDNNVSCIDDFYVWDICDDNCTNKDCIGYGAGLVRGECYINSRCTVGTKGINLSSTFTFPTEITHFEFIVFYPSQFSSDGLSYSQEQEQDEDATSYISQHMPENVPIYYF